MIFNLGSGNPAAYAIAEARVIIADRGMLIVDMILATIIPILLQIALWSSLFNNGLEIEFTFGEIIAYYLFVVCLSRINNAYDIVEHLSNLVHEGTLDPHLVRPLPYWAQRLSGFIGGSFIYLSVILIALLADAVVRNWHMNMTVGELILFLLVAFCVLFTSQVLTFFVGFTFAILVVWTTRPELSLSLLILLQTVLGGTLLPPDLWGGWLYPLMKYNPFAYMLAAPAEFLTTHDFEKAIFTLVGSIFYIIIFSILSKILWRYVEKTYEGVGG